MSSDSDERYLALRVVMMPRDTNPYGTIFGGVILSYIDQAGAVGARRELQALEYPSQTLVTVAVDAVEFHEPVFVGDTVSFLTRLQKIGRTSIAMHVSVETERAGIPHLLTQAQVTYVAVQQDKVDGRRRPVSIKGSA